LCKGGLGGLHTLDPHYVYLAAQHVELTRANVDLESVVEKLSAEIERRDEALCLYSEVVKLLEAKAIVRPKEIDSLLARIRALMKK
jgi:ABC-type uncharacterized transport system ATPase subunit